MGDKQWARRVKKKVFQLIDWTCNARYASLIAAIEHILDCRVFLTPCARKGFKGKDRAETYTRSVESHVSWPEHEDIVTYEHWIFFDPEAPPERQALLVGHELGHVFLHLGREPERLEWHPDGTIRFSVIQENDADLFAICLLRFYRRLGKEAILRILESYRESCSNNGIELSGRLCGDLERVRSLFDEGLLDWAA